MSSSELATIRLRAVSEWTDVSITDPYGRPISAGSGSLEQTVKAGVYQLEYRAGAALESTLVAVVAGETLAPDPVTLELASPAPVAGTTPFRPEDAACAREHSLRLHKAGATSGLIVMVRGVAEGRVAPEAIAAVRALDKVAAWEWPGEECAIWSTVAQPGGATLRAPRDRLSPDLDPVLDQSLFLCAGWQTLVFVPCGTRGPEFADASIHMAPMDVGWDGESPGAFAVEALTSRLRTNAGPPPASLIERTLAETPTNPMASILLAHLLRGHPEQEQALTRLVAGLVELLPDHPDVRALAWLDPARGERRPAPLVWPPLLAAGYEAAEALDAAMPGVLRDGSMIVRAGGHRFKEGIWMAWHPNAVQVAAASPVLATLPGVEADFSNPATQRVLAYLGREYGEEGAPDATALVADSVAGEIAYATRLPSAAVARALTDIESALPVGDQAEPKPPPEPRRATSPDDPLTTPEFVLERVLRGLALMFTLAIVPLLVPLQWSSAGALAGVAIVMRSILLTAICALAGSDVRRYGALSRLIVFVMWVELAVIGLVLAFAATGDDVAALGLDVPATTVLCAWLAADFAIGVGVGRLWFHAYRRRWKLRELTPGNHRTLAALSELMHSVKREVAPTEVAGNVDDYLAAAAPRHRRAARLALREIAVLPVTRGRAPFALVPKRVRFEIVRRALMRRHRAATAVRIGHQLGALGYYADPRAAGEDGALNALPRGGTEPGITTIDPRAVAQELSFDAVVIGSGPTGALVAYRLAERGRRTLIVEKGQYVRPSRRTGGVLQSLPSLLDDGGLDLARDVNMKVLDVTCVGGRSMAAAGAWTPLAPSIAQRWNELGAGLDADRFDAAWRRVEAWLPGAARSQQKLSAGAARVVHAMTDGAALPRPAPGDGRTANDLSARSQGVLDTLLPWGQRRFGDALQVLPECEAKEINLRDKRPVSVDCELPNGRKLRIRTELVVLAAGALATPELLRASGIRRNVGRRFSFDLTTTLFADFGVDLGPSGGAQVLAAPDAHDPNFVVETVWQPLWLLAMTMPGLFADHAYNMERREQIVPVRVHVGIDRRFRVAVPYRSRPRTADLEPEELKLLVARLGRAAELLLKAGATRVMPTTVDYTVCRTPAELGDLVPVERSDELSFAARPQGGAPMSAEPAQGVVGPDLRVHGHRGIYVCDASVFPVSVTRAPNLTAMALAEYAAERMA